MAGKSNPFVDRYILQAEDRTKAATASAKSNFASLEKQAAGLRTALQGLAGAFALRAGVNFARDTLATADALGEAAEKAGVTAEQLQVLRKSAELNGGSVEGMDRALARLQQTLGTVGLQAQGLKDGIDPAGLAMQRLGVAVLDAGGQIRSTGQVLPEIIDRLQAVANPAERAALAADIFGRRIGPELQILINQGTGALRDMDAQMRATGALMSNDLVARAGELNDQLQALGGAIRTNFQAGFLEGFVGEFKDLQAAATDPRFVKAVNDLGSGLGTAFRRSAEVLPTIVGNLENILRIVLAIKGATTGGALLGTFFGTPGKIIGGLAGGALGAATPDIARAALAPGAAAPGTGRIERTPAAVAALQAPTLPTRPLVFPDRAAAQAADRAAERAAKAAADAVARSAQVLAGLREQIALYGQTGEAARLRYQIENDALAGLLPQDKARALALVDQIAALEQATQAEEARKALMDEGARLTEQARTAQEALNASLADYQALLDAKAITPETYERLAQAARDAAAAQDPGVQLTRQLRTEQEIYNDTIAEYARLLQAGSITQQTFARGVEAAAKKLKDQGDQMNEAAIQAARNIQTAFADFLFDPFSQGLDGMLSGFVNVLRRAASEALAAQLGKALFGDLATGGKGGGSGLLGGALKSVFGSLFHTGGVVGQPAPQRAVPMALFAGAPRYHGGGLAGMAPDEVPAILRRGEEVLTARDPRHRANGGAAPMNIRNINVFDTQVIGDYLATGPGERLILNIVSRNKGVLA